MDYETKYYETKYKEALERAKEILQFYNEREYDFLFPYVEEDLEAIFPELKESEDERIRKELIEYIRKTTRVNFIGKCSKKEAKKFIAWLEKQGEQKPTTIDIDKMVNDYANNKERGNEEFGKPVNCMIRAYRQGLKDAIGKVVLKPTWSEDDERICRTIIADIANDKSMCKFEISKGICDEQINWLKFLKQRIGG